MSLSPPDTRSRKRDRQIQFDLNRSTPHVVRKIRKPNTPLVNTAKVGEMSKKGDEQFRDLSKTIMSGMPNIPSGANTQQVDPTTQNTSRQAVTENMEEVIKKMVDQSVTSQVADMKRIMADLTATVGRLSIVVQQTQKENKSLKENLPNTSKAAHRSPDKIEASELSNQSYSSSRASSINGRDQSRYDNRPRVDKWGLEFDGDNNKLAVEDFVFRLERLQSQYGVSWREVLDNFHMLVKGPAEKWYWLFIQTNYITEWTTLKQALLKQYQSSRSSFELMRDMVERRQQPGESIDAFFFAMTQLRSRLTLSMPEIEMIKMLKKNLRESIGKIVYPMAVSSVEELRVCCLDAEKTFLKRDIIKPTQASNMRYVRQVNELCEKPIEDHEVEEVGTGEEVAEARAIRMNSQASRVLVCWNCQQSGHVFMDCPAEERSIFCYKCGKPEVTSPNCSNCRNRNFRKSEGRAGDLRATTNP